MSPLTIDLLKDADSFLSKKILAKLKTGNFDHVSDCYSISQNIIRLYIAEFI